MGKEKIKTRTLEHHEDAAPKTVLTANLLAARPPSYACVSAL
jgi:hypothetical protein